MDTNKVAIFDVDGVLIDMVYTVYCVAPWLRKIKEFSPLWEFLRKLIILFFADKVVDDRLKKTTWATDYFSRHNGDSVRFIITNRPFILGSKKRLIRQLDYVYGENFFKAENIYSSFNKSKAEVIKKYILKPGVFGDMFDDHIDNFRDVPDPIRLYLV